MTITSSQKKQCPKCAEEIDSGAIACQFCNYSFSDDIKNDNDIPSELNVAVQKMEKY
jgi:hypothetical protein